MEPVRPRDVAVRLAKGTAVLIGLALAASLTDVLFGPTIMTNAISYIAVSGLVIMLLAGGVWYTRYCLRRR